MTKIFLILIILLQSVSQDNWVSELEKQIDEIDNNLTGEIGLFVKNLEDNRVMSCKEDRNWYFASTVKVLIAIAVLQKIEEGKISLDDKITLLETDFVDGSGDLISQKPGTSYTVATLLDMMIKNSDSVAADMLLRLIGEEELNRQIREKMISDGINKITSILQVRYDAYSEIHENAKKLTNMDIISVNSKSSYQERFAELLKRMKVEKKEVKATSIEDAYDRYYKSGLNSGSLESMGKILEKLYKGELLNKENTLFLLKSMEKITTGDRRIKAGLPDGTRYAQKTGTQVRRICNFGIIFPEGKEDKPIIIAASVKEFDEFSDAEKTLENVGSSLTNVLLKK